MLPGIEDHADYLCKSEGAYLLCMDRWGRLALAQFGELSLTLQPSARRHIRA